MPFHFKLLQNERACFQKANTFEFFSQRKQHLFARVLSEGKDTNFWVRVISLVSRPLNRSHEKWRLTAPANRKYSDKLAYPLINNLFEILIQGGHALWKTGKMVKKNPRTEKSGNLILC